MNAQQYGSFFESFGNKSICMNIEVNPFLI
jgi:hypothetical protein